MPHLQGRPLMLRTHRPARPYQVWRGCKQADRLAQQGKKRMPDNPEISAFKRAAVANPVRDRHMLGLSAIVGKGGATIELFPDGTEKVLIDADGVRQNYQDDTPLEPEWADGNGDSVKVGNINRRGQLCCGTRWVKGTDHNQYAYKVCCTHCEHIYGANGSDMHERKCPKCQGGEPGIDF